MSENVVFPQKNRNVDTLIDVSGWFPLDLQTQTPKKKMEVLFIYILSAIFGPERTRRNRGLRTPSPSDVWRFFFDSIYYSYMMGGNP